MIPDHLRIDSLMFSLTMDSVDVHEFAYSICSQDDYSIAE